MAVFVGLNTRDYGKAAPQAFVRAFDIPYVNLFDPDGALLLRFSGQLPPNAIPVTLVVDPEGRVAARIIGETDPARPQLGVVAADGRIAFPADTRPLPNVALYDELLTQGAR